MAPNMGQTITWTNDDPIHWHLYVWPALMVFNAQKIALFIVIIFEHNVEAN